MSSIGIDAEVHRPLPEGVAELITVADEQAMLDTLARQNPEIAWETVLFSAKESIFKAWFPLALEWLDFTQCLVSIDAKTGFFNGRLLIPGPCVRGIRLSAFTGRWEVTRSLDAEHILTAVAVE
ncbi:4'-phosphopantetheinyl transferase superfamily protein [Glutamicibacter ardleyensis]|uniref:4'-phosphopantetheinyl transferase superfamily protein n=1 Tax=Glutamicibacter ardleyensis TaxID=225894 RepID=UPI003FD184D2